MGAETGRAPREAALVARLVHEFLDVHAPSVLTDSPNTLKTYRDTLSVYLQYLESRGVTPGDLSRKVFERPWLEGFVAWLKSDRGNSNDTCNVRLGAMRTFLDFAGSREPGMLYLYQDAKAIRRQNPNRTKVAGLTRDAVTALLAAPDTSTPIGRRDATFMAVMYSTACRIDEIRSLTAGQVRLGGPKPHVVVRGKGGSTRTCYLLPKAVALLRAYMREVLGADPDASALVFPSSHGGGVMSEEAWAKRLRVHAATARESCPAVPHDMHWHRLRHAKASHWLEDKMNVVEVQFLLGHRQLSTTMRYLDITSPQQLEALATIDPEKEGDVGKKWRNEDGTLRGFCGMSGGRGAGPKSKP